MFNENVRPSETVTVTVYPHPVNPIPEIVTAHIQSVATDMLHHSGFGKCDFEDLCQELTLAVIKAFDRYDNTKASYYTYTQVIVGHAGFAPKGCSIPTRKSMPKSPWWSVNTTTANRLVSKNPPMR